MSQIEELRTKIDEAADAYYNRGVALVTDDEFDTMLDMLRRLDHTDPRLNRVGAEASLNKVDHEHPMGSLDNIDASKPDELSLYVRRNKELALRDNLYHVTPKIDGSSVAATYDGAGRLVRLVTRGNGRTGQDITAKAPYIQGLPTQLPVQQAMTVRGEVVMYRDDFLNYLESAKLEGVRNPRNVGNGILVRSECFGAGLLHFHAFNVVCPSETLNSVQESYEFLRSMDFDPPEFEVVAADGIPGLIESMIQRAYPYDVDGLVIRVNESDAQALINDGGDDLRPRSDRAIKFNSKKAETIVTGVNITVGQTGKITPTLTVEPVEIGGVVVSNVLIYNFDEPERLRLGVGDKVRIVLAGDIIPKVLTVVDKADPPQPITAPAVCPCCGQPLSKKQLLKGESVDLYCTNPDCPGIQFETIKNYIGSSKRGMGILGIGEHLIRHLMDSGRVKKIIDLYSLTVDEMRVMPLGNGVVGAKRAQTIYDNIQSSKNESVAKVIGSLGVEGLGESRAELMMEQMKDKELGSLDSLADWATATQSNVLTKLVHPHLPGTFLTTAHASLSNLYPMLLKMVEIGVGVASDNEATNSDNEATSGDKPFDGKNFCFTGTRQFSELVEQLGGTIKSGVSKKVDYLVQKEADAQTTKAKKAKSLGTTVIGIPELEKMIEDVAPGMIKSDNEVFDEILNM